MTYEGLRGQCCTCEKWQPYTDGELGRCAQDNSTTPWSDGCKHWESNEHERDAKENG
jgi:hypothetical protein